MEVNKVLYFACILLLSYLGLATGNLRIHGGKHGFIQDNPWLVSMQIRKFHSCGGVIISANKILSAAHCFYNRKIDSTYDIVAGVTNLTDKSAVRANITNVYMHPKYNHKTFDYDIAVIEIDPELKFSEAIEPIKLPEREDVIPEGIALTISGWGATSKDSKKGVKSLETAVIYSMNWNECFMRLSPINQFTDRMICAGVASGEQDTCRGDSGGPVESQGVLIGIVSWGASCGLPGFPGAYTNVAYFRSWIEEMAGV